MTLSGSPIQTGSSSINHPLDLFEQLPVPPQIRTPLSQHPSSNSYIVAELEVLSEVWLHLYDNKSTSSR